MLDLVINNMYEYEALVLEVVDGDTIKILADLGCYIKITMTVRMLGINSPELHAIDPKPGQKAKEYLKNMIEGKMITIKTHKDEKEKYGRLLAEVYLNGDDINKRMIDNGYAVAYFGGAR